MPNTSVRFVEQSGLLSVVELKTTGRPELLSELTEVLFHERLQVVRFETKRDGGTLIGRLSIVEYDGAPIAPKRRLQVQAAILGALDARSQLNSAEPVAV
jgi:UTP:GlnB (protein PII) uridylyltransferase